MEYDFLPSRRRIGRPLSFDRDIALNAAMRTFWRHGYETTSIADLTRAMQITPPSLYTAFGDKKQLFLEAVKCYVGDLDVTRLAIETAPTSQAAARDFLISAAIAYTGDDTPKGCLLASATASCSESSSDVQQAIAQVRRRVQAFFEERIARDIAECLLPGDTSAEALAGLVIAVTQGLSVLARDGQSRATLLAVAEATLSAWRPLAQTSHGTGENSPVR